jgi:GNAT superfamily N-acetyltransferase
MQDDEAESLVGMLSGLARIWPVIGFIQFVVPSLRDYVRGYVWEDEGQPVGVVLLHRQGRTHTWEIVRAAVMPDHRRQGIGRQLVQASINYVRKRGGKVALLDVIAGNTPAYRLYEQTGFEPFERRTAFDYTRDEPPPEIPLPADCTIAPMALAVWRCKYELASRIVPPSVQRFQPVREARFRPRLSGRLATRIVSLFDMAQERAMVVLAPGDGQVVAVADYSVHTRQGGVNNISVRVDPNRADVAAYLLHALIRTIQSLSPGRRIELTIPHWQSKVMEAANAAGCVAHVEYHRMGMLV